MKSMNLKCLIVASLCALFSVHAAETKKPNIIFILSDDLGYGELSCYGQKKFQTPNIDQLAAEGMRFTQAYAGCHVCAPCRSTLMTGLHTGHTPIRNNSGGHYLHDEDVTVAEVLKKAGYATGGFGKWGLGTEDSPGAPWRQGFDQFFGYLHQVHAHFYYTYFLWNNDQKFMLPENEGAKHGRYSHDVIQQQALDFIRKHKDTNFFCYLPYTIPHYEYIVPEDSEKKYRGKFPKIEVPSPGPGYSQSDDPAAALAGMIDRLDHSVGEVMALLKELKIDDNTIVFFGGDNGPQATKYQPLADFFQGSGPLRGYKSSFYEGGIRVPFIARWPGKIKPGTESTLPLAYWDFMPTAAELSGAKALANTDGISFLPTLLQKKQKQHEFLYWEMPGNTTNRRTAAVRLGDWKAVKPKPNAPVELYDLKNDLAETNNVADANPAIMEKIQAIMTREHTTERTEPETKEIPTVKDFIR